MELYNFIIQMWIILILSFSHSYKYSNSLDYQYFTEQANLYKEYQKFYKISLRKDTIWQAEYHYHPQNYKFPVIISKIYHWWYVVLSTMFTSSNNTFGASLKEIWKQAMEWIENKLQLSTLVKCHTNYRSCTVSLIST